MSIFPQTLLFRGAAPTFTRPQSFGFLSAGTLKTLVYAASVKNVRYFTKTFLTPVKPFATDPGPFAGCDHDQTYLCVHLFRWGTFGVFVVNCDLINNNSSTVINFGDLYCRSTVRCKRKYYIVNVFNV